MSAGERTRGNPLLRAADRYAGIPLIFAGGALRRKRPRPADLGRLGIVNSTNIGDTVLLSAVIRDLARDLVGTELVVFASPAMCPLLAGIERVAPVPFPLGRPREALGALRDARLDAALDFDQWPRIEPVLIMFSGARWRGGFRSPRQHRHYAYDGVVEHLDSVHELDNYRRLAELLGVRSDSLPTLAAPGVLDEDRLPPRPYAVLHLWPTGLASQQKQWPEDRWRSLARALRERGLALALTGAAADVAGSTRFREACVADGIATHDFAGQLSLPQVVDLIHHAELVVSVNTGIMHLAAATGTATVGLNGPTSSRRWGPLGDRARSVDSALPGCGFLHFGWEYDGRRADCMCGISVEDVLVAVDELTGSA